MPSRITRLAYRARSWFRSPLLQLGTAVSTLLLAGLLISRGAEPAYHPYPDHTRLLYSLDADGGEQPVKTPQDWAKRRRDILLGMQEAMGKLPDRSHLPPLDVKVTQESKEDGYTRLTLSLLAEKSPDGSSEDRIPAYLLIPANRLPGEKLPAVLALHQTNSQGKGVVAIASGPGDGYGIDLVKRGYVVLCPDYPSFGDYPYDFAAAFRSGRYASGTMKGIFNHMRCVDLLQSRDEVDARRIAAVGHSLGGHNALFLAVFDPRVKAVVTSCGWTPFADYYSGNLAGWTSDRYMPRLRDIYKLVPKAVPFDFYEVLAAIAPRPIFSNSPLHDANFDVAGVKKAVTEARKVYAVLGAPDALQVRHPDGGHAFPPEVRAEAYAFLDSVLKPAAAATKESATKDAGKESSKDQSKIPDLTEQLPRIPPHEPADELASLKVLPPFRVELAAAEPLVRSPVACDFDENGRLYVCEMIDYPELTPGQPLGRVVVLEDTKGDGHYDKSTVLADKIAWPTAVLCYDGGVFVGAAPDILYLKDTHGTGKADSGKADVRKVVFTGFGRDNVQGLLNSFRWGLDNRIHGATSSSGGHVRRPEQPESQAVNLSGRDFSFDPRRLDLRPESGGAQHGMCFDDWGNKFVCSNSDQIQAVMYEDRDLARNPHLAAPGPRVSIAADGPAAPVFRLSPAEPWRVVRTRLRVAGLVRGPTEGGKPAGYFTSATGVTVYRGDAWPAEYRGQAFIGEVAGNLVHRKTLTQQGVGFVARRVDDHKEFLASPDIWFRPVQFANAPDGSLYVLDMYREVIEHPDSLPVEIRKHLDLTSGRERGRIYRIVPEDFRRPPLPALGKATTEQLVSTLEHRNGWHRDTAARLLYQRRDKSAAGPLRELAAKSNLPEARMHALYALAGLGELTPEVVLHALADEDPHVREHAVRLAEGSAAESAAVRDKLLSMTDDPSQRVRYRLAFTLGAIPSSDRPAALARILRRDAADPWVRLAVLTSLADGAGPVLSELVADEKFRGSRDGREAIAQLAKEIGAAGGGADVSAAVRAVEALPAGESDLASSIIKALSQGLSRSGTAAGEKLALSTSAGGKAGEILRDLLAAARTTATDPKRPTAERAEAVRTLALGNLADARVILTESLTARQPQQVQLAAVAALDRFAEPDVGSILVGAWPHLTPRLRSAAADALYARPERLSALLDAAETGKVPWTDLDPSRLRTAAASAGAAGGHADAKLRTRIDAALSKLQLGRRQDVIDAYKGALALKGDPEKGRAVFRKTCTACHRLENTGNEIGPNLATMQNRGPEAILVNVLDPNREVNPQYVEYALTTRDGRTLTGLLAAETATSVTLKRAEGATDTVLRADIEKIRSTGLSLMPEGLERQVDRQGMADLIAYLMSVK